MSRFSQTLAYRAANKRPVTSRAGVQNVLDWEDTASGSFQRSNGGGAGGYAAAGYSAAGGAASVGAGSRSAGVGGSSVSGGNYGQAVNYGQVLSSSMSGFPHPLDMDSAALGRACTAAARDMKRVAPATYRSSISRRLRHNLKCHQPC